MSSNRLTMTNDMILQQLHTVLFEILCEFDRICRKHHIQYFLDSGTALGAVRHGGFIPWDDDIDVGMLRHEYEKFLIVAQNELSDKFFLLSPESDSAYMKYHAKLVKRNTIFPEKGTDNLKHRGIYIDIFPFDKVSEDSMTRKNVIRKVLLVRNFIRLKRTNNNGDGFSLKILCFLLKIIPLRLLESYQKKLWNHYNHTSSKYVTCYFYKMLVGRDLYFPISAMSPSIETNFEGRTFMIMNGYNKYLKIMYNDYMQLPPEDKRTCHFNGDIIFDAVDTFND